MEDHAGADATAAQRERYARVRARLLPHTLAHYTRQRMWALQLLKVVLLVSSCALERLPRRARDQPEALMQNGINKLTGFLQDEISEPTFSAEEYMSQYTAVYNMCTQRAPHEYSEKLYERYKGAFTDYLGDRVRSRPGSSCSSSGIPCRSLRAAAYMPRVKSRVQLHLKVTSHLPVPSRPCVTLLPLQAAVYNLQVLPKVQKQESGPHLLRSLKVAWENQEVMVRWLSRFFNYLDRFARCTRHAVLREQHLKQVKLVVWVHVLSAHCDLAECAQVLRRTPQPPNARRGRTPRLPRCACTQLCGFADR